MRGGNLIIPFCVVKRIFPLGPFSLLSLCSLVLTPLLSATFRSIYLSIILTFTEHPPVPDPLPDS